MRKIWGNVIGERFWYMLRGEDIEEISTNVRTVGHSHVLHPQWRDYKKSRDVMRRLIIKAASRLRRKGFLCTNLKISLKTISGKKIKNIEKFHKINDSFSLLEKSERIWKKLILNCKKEKIRQVNVVLYGLYPKNSSQTNLLDIIENKNQRMKRKNILISETIDRINSRFGRDSITIGTLPNEIFEFSGTKVAFTRIPEIKEFYE